MIKKYYFVTALLAAGVAMTSVNAATLKLVPQSEVVKDCPVVVDVVMDTEGDEVNSVDFALVLDDSYVVNEVKTDDGVLRTYSTPSKRVAKEGDYKGKELLSLLASTSSPNGYKGEGKLMSLVVTPKSDDLKMDIYMVPSYDGDDTNLMVEKDGKVVDVLNKVENLDVKVKDGTCNVSKLPELTLSQPETSIKAKEVKDIVKETTEVNTERVFDSKQKFETLKSKGLYVAIAGVLVLLVGILLLGKGKKDKKGKKVKK